MTRNVYNNNIEFTQINHLKLLLKITGKLNNSFVTGFVYLWYGNVFGEICKIIFINGKSNRKLKQGRSLWSVTNWSIQSSFQFIDNFFKQIQGTRKVYTHTCERRFITKLINNFMFFLRVDLKSDENVHIRLNGRE